MLRRFGLRPRYAALAALVGVTGMLMISSCSKSSPTQVLNNTNSWAFTATVLDGYTGSPISAAKVSYKTIENKDSTVLTSSLGSIRIEGLAPGAQSFRILLDSTYTSAVVNAEGVPDSTSKTLTYLDVTATTKLFPLKGAVSGRVMTQRNALAVKNPAVGVLVSVSYTNADMSIAFPKAFQVATGTDGSFSFSGLPVATGCIIMVANATVEGIDFSPGSITAPTLVPVLSVPMGSIIMTPINAANFKQLQAAPLVISPNQVISVTYSDVLDSVSYATLEGVSGSQSVIVTSSISGNKISITPSISLVNGSQYYLTIYAFGFAGGDSTSKTTLTVKGGGLVDVTASNVLDGNKLAINGLGLTDSMVFTFRDSIVKGTASVTIGTTPVLVNVSTSGTKLTIKPNGTWQSTTYTVNVSANLSDGTTSTFNFNLTTVGGLAFTVSNIYDPKTNTGINGIGMTDTISITANKTLASAQVTLGEQVSGNPIPVSVSVNGAVISIVPLNALKPATSYSVTVTAQTSIGETKSFAVYFTTASSTFYPLVDNIRYDNDPTKPVLNFSPNGTIFIKMSALVQSSTAQITGGGNPAVAVAVNADTIKITPNVNLVQNTAYNLVISASSKTGTVFNANGGNYVNGFYVSNPFAPVTSNVRYNNNPAAPVLNFAPNGQFVVVMSDSVTTATASLIGGAGISVTVKLAGDTIRIIPQTDLAIGTSYTIYLNATSKTGLTYIANTSAAPFVSGLMAQNQVRVVASNVLGTDDIGVTTFPVTGTPYFVMSDDFDSTTIAISGFSVSYNLRTDGDTIFVKPVSNLAAGITYYINIAGKTKTGTSFLIDNSASLQNFTTERDVYVVKTNMVDNSGNELTNFPLYGTMWVKFSEPLSADLTTIQWTASAAAVKLYGDQTKSTYNATVRVNVDTLFVTPIAALVAITYGNEIGFKVQVKTASGKIQGSAIDFKATVTSSGVYIVSTNTIDALGNSRTDFGLQDTVRAVFNTGIAKINAATFLGANLAGGVATINDLKLDATGDSLTLVPPIKLANNTAYSVSITNVDLLNGLKNQTVALNLGWTTVKGLRFASANDMANVGTYRTFNVTGDSLVITFSEAVDITKGYALGGVGAWAHAQYAWSNGNKTVTIKGGVQDTLVAETYNSNPDYTLSGTPDYGPITFTAYQLSSNTSVSLNSGTAADWVVTRPAINIFSVSGIEMLNTNLKKDANKGGLYNNTFNYSVSTLVTKSLVVNRDSCGVHDTLKLWFSRAVDNTKILAAPSLYFILQKGNPAAGAELNYTVSISTDQKTVFILPVDSLKRAAPPTGQAYTLTVQNVPALGLATSLAGGKVPTYALVFSTVPTSPITLTKESVSILAMDTSLTPAVRNKIIPYSPEIATYMVSGLTLPVVAVNHVYFYFNEVCWNAHHNDSITGYQVSVKGYEGDWIEIENSIIPTNTYNTWDPGTVSKVIKVNLDLSAATDLNGQNVLSRLQRPTGAAGYSNPPDLFNYGNVVSVKIRPIYDVNADNMFEYATDLYGSWSSALSYSDNVAPCDSDFVSVANVANVAAGGVSVASNLVWNFNLATSVDSTHYIELTFPEDMDITTSPTISFARGTALLAAYTGAAAIPTTPSVAASNGLGYNTGWSSARVYRTYIKFPTAADYSAGDGVAQPWTGFAYNVSVFNMKDASGNAIQGTGNAGTVDLSGSLDLLNGSNSQAFGSASLIGWAR